MISCEFCGDEIEGGYPFAEEDGKKFCTYYCLMRAREDKEENERRN